MFGVVVLKQCIYIAPLRQTGGDDEQLEILKNKRYIVCGMWCTLTLNIHSSVKLVFIAPVNII